MWGPGPPAYRLFVGLWLNAPRARMQWADAFARGAWAAASDEPLGSEWADAAAPDEVQAAELHFRANAERQLVRAKRKIGFLDG